MPGIRPLAIALLHRLQGLPGYRRLGRRLAAPRLTLRETTPADDLAVHRWLNPQDAAAPVPQRNPAATHWVAEVDGRLAGIVQLVRHPPEHFPYTGYWLFGLTIKHGWRGLGVGAALSQAVLTRARAEGAPDLKLVVLADNTPAIRLYRKLGFEPYPLPAVEAPAGLRRLVLRKLLAETTRANAAEDIVT